MSMIIRIDRSPEGRNAGKEFKMRTCKEPREEKQKRYSSGVQHGQDGEVKWLIRKEKKDSEVNSLLR